MRRPRFDRLEEFARRPGHLWLSFFVYAAVMAGLVQLVVLPHILPELHDGHGLLIEGDWVYHNQVTAGIAKRINEEGWSAWRLRNGEHGLYGISSLFYAFIAPEPWTLIPLYAALHATSTLLLVHILRLFVPSGGIAVVAALSFLVFPSALITYTQITKDAYSICGGFMFLYGWLLLVGWAEGQSHRRAIGIVALIASGATVIWIARPYLVQVMMGLSAGFATLIVIRLIVLSLRRVVRPTRAVLASAMAWLMVAGLTPFNALGANMYLVDSSTSPPDPVSLSPGAVSLSTQPPGPSAEAARPSTEVARPSTEAARVSDETVTPSSRVIDPWKRSWWVPSAIGSRLYSLALLRLRWKDNRGGSTIDQEENPSSLKELAAYLPRLMAVGFLAPFPYQWSADGAFDSTTLMRRVVGVEMVLTYLALAGLVLSGWRWRARLEFWIVVAYGSVTTLIWAYIVPNVGSLHRARFGFLMVLVALGFAGLLSSRRTSGSTPVSD